MPRRRRQRRRPKPQLPGLEILFDSNDDECDSDDNDFVVVLIDGVKHRVKKSKQFKIKPVSKSKKKRSRSASSISSKVELKDKTTKSPFVRQSTKSQMQFLT